MCGEGSDQRTVERGGEGWAGVSVHWHLLRPVHTASADTSLSISRAHATSWDLLRDPLGSALAQAGPGLSTSHLSGLWELLWPRSF